MAPEADCVEGGRIVGSEAGRRRDSAHRVALEGPPKGMPLQNTLYVSGFDWAWLAVFSHTTFYEGEG